MKRESLLTDRCFKNGFKVRGMGLPIYGDEIEKFGDNFNINALFQYEEPNSSLPEWTIAQWASRFPFHDINNTLHNNNYRFTKLGAGKYRYDNQSKILIADTVTGELAMELKASQCYKYPRIKGQEWPHFLIERNIGDVNTPSGLTKISDAKKINVKIDVRLDNYKDYMKDTADEKIHAIIFIYYLFIADFDCKKGEFKDMLWFGLPLWDNRRAITPKQSFADIGTKASASEKWIYNNCTKKFFNKKNNLYTPDGKMIFNEWKSVDCNVLPLIKKALSEARHNGYMKRSLWDNLYINGMYFGFEACGTYDARISVKNIDIIKEFK